MIYYLPVKYSGQLRYWGGADCGRRGGASLRRAQAVILTRNRTRQTVHGFAYTGLLKCAECGGVYLREEELEGSLPESCGSSSSGKRSSTGPGKLYA